MEIYSHISSEPDGRLKGTKIIRSDGGGPYWVPVDDLSVRSGAPDEAQSRRVLRALDHSAPVYINGAEVYAGCNGEGELVEALKIANLIQLAVWARQENPTLRFSLYNIPGRTGYANHKTGNAWRDYWRASFARYPGILADLQHFVTCECYAGPDLVKWKYETSRNLDAYRKWAKGKPVIAFVSPRVNGRASDGLLPASVLRKQLEWLRGRVDAVVIWDDGAAIDGAYWKAAGL